MSRCKVGVQLWLQHTTTDELRTAWRTVDHLSGGHLFDLAPVQRLLELTRS